MLIGESKSRRILIVEDEMLIALNLEDMLVQLGHIVVAMATRTPEALKLAAESDIDLAILDLNLSGLSSLPVADVLRSRGIPFMFATGYGSNGLTESYLNEVVLGKPYGVSDLQNAINNVIFDYFP
jgi:CheY-like chemotaxis protein